MMEDDVILSIHEDMPKYNREMLVDFTRRSVNSAVEKIEAAFREMVRLFNGVINYRGVVILSPEERVIFEIEWQRRQKLRRRPCGVNTAITEHVLARYELEYNGVAKYVYFYLPYLKDDLLIIENTRYGIARAITGKVFTRSSNGLSCKVLRSPIRFSTHSHWYQSAVSGRHFTEVLARCHIHQKKTTAKGKKMIRETVLHYVLAKYGFAETISKLRYNPEDIQFVALIENDVEVYDYVSVSNIPSRPIFIKFKKELFEADLTLQKIVATLHHILSSFTHYTIADLYSQDAQYWRGMLGMITHTTTDFTTAKHHADNHMNSVNGYLDPASRDRMQVFGVNVSNIYDLLCYVFVNFNQLIANTHPADLYNQRVDVLDGVLVTTVVKEIFTKMYRVERDPKRMNDRTVTSALRFPPNLFAARLNRESRLANPVTMHNDNWLLAVGSSMIRVGDSANNTIGVLSDENKLHSSVAIATSVTALSKEHPGIVGHINPYLEIDKEGGIIRPDYADEIDDLNNYLHQ